LRIVAARREGRTVVETLRQEGLARCSRPLPAPERPGAVRLVVSQLGPGFVRGDAFATDGTLHAGADLIVAAQSATRILGRGAPSEARVRYELASKASLFVAGEPAIAYDGAAHRSSARIDLADGAVLAWLDVVAPYHAFERITSVLRVYAGGRLAVHDALALTPNRLHEAIGSAFYVRAGTSPERGAELLDAAGRASKGALAGRALRIGVGTTGAGGVMLRARGSRARDVRSALFEILTELRRSDAPFG
jgi:urease accessory protein UreH